jgi:hypothetical protein
MIGFASSIQSCGTTCNAEDNTFSSVVHVFHSFIVFHSRQVRYGIIHIMIQNRFVLMGSTRWYHTVHTVRYTYSNQILYVLPMRMR